MADPKCVVVDVADWNDRIFGWADFCGFEGFVDQVITFAGC